MVTKISQTAFKSLSKVWSKNKKMQISLLCSEKKYFHYLMQGHCVFAEMSDITKYKVNLTLGGKNEGLK